ncbi:MAG TPA: nitrilase-related carbon-nitrogen hydrolase [Rectinemataceae bacterium]|nr:nitrilase-related carbon-nitrogen hydrolase [Rectinemataceae bacterium]
MKIVLVQFAPARDGRAASRQRVATLLSEAQGDWFVLPEMALSGFSMNLGAASWGDEDFAFFAGLSQRKQAYVTVGGVRKGRNCAFTFDPKGELISTYEKRHLFSISGEDKTYKAGDGVEGFELETRTGTRLGVGPSVCYDLRFPYHYWKQAPGAGIFFVIAAWPRSRREHWRSLLAARAIENQAFVVGVNRTRDSYPAKERDRLGDSGESETEYAGDSLLLDPRGRILLDCGEAEGAFAAEIDPAEVAAWRNRFGAMADRLE